EVLAGELEQHADDLVVHRAQPLGAMPAEAILEQQPLGGGAARDQRRLEALRDRVAQLPLVLAVELGKLFKLGRDGRRVEQFGGDILGWREHRPIGIAERGLGVTVVSAEATTEACSEASSRCSLARVLEDIFLQLGFFGVYSSLVAS